MVLLSVLACVAAQPHGTIVIASQKYAPVTRRHAAIWNLPPAVELKYIQRPSEDHAAAVQAASAGPTDLAPELPSKGTHWHSRQSPPYPSRPPAPTCRLARPGNDEPRWLLSGAAKHLVRRCDSPST